MSVRSRGIELKAVAKTLLFVFAFILAAAAHAAAQTTTVVLVRHAEKADESSDPVLSDAGKARAQSLLNVLSGREFSAIYTTQYQRTRLTAAPLAEKLGVEVTVVAASPMEAHLQQTVERVKANAGKTVLIVGHSNTVPALIKALGGPDVVIANEEYDNVFVLTIADGAVKMERTKY